MSASQSTKTSISSVQKSKYKQVEYDKKKSHMAEIVSLLVIGDIVNMMIYIFIPLYFSHTL